MKQMMKHVNKVGDKFKSLQGSQKEKAKRHGNDLEQMVKLLEDTKSQLRQERDRYRRLEEKTQKEKESLVLQVRELRVKLSTSRMREEDYVRSIKDMQTSMELKKANNESLLAQLTHQNEKFQAELRHLGD